MGKSLGVNSVDLNAAAGEVDTAADDLAVQHASAHERVAAAQAGWIGASAAALAARVAQWEEETVDHYTELVTHSDHLRSAAADYADTDADAASGIDSAVCKLSDDMGL